MESASTQTRLNHRDFLGGRLWASLCERGLEREARQCQVLLREGERPSRVLALLSGEVAVTRLSGADRQVVLGLRRGGELLGELAVLGRTTRSATVTATTSCRLSEFTVEAFHDFLHEDDVRERLHRHALSRLRESEDIRADLATKTVRARLASALVRLSEVVGHLKGQTVVIHVTQDVIAEYIGCSRNAVGLAIGELKQAGLVETHASGRIVLTDTAKLKGLTT